LKLSELRVVAFAQFAKKSVKAIAEPSPESRQ